MYLINMIISFQNYFLVKFGIGQIIFIRNEKSITNDKFDSVEDIKDSTINGC